ncbi:hypothetical protein [Roseivirga sp.]|uniref:hypothetical protein n=1 Tax=Roseivirga sp. TaxID=1964215 RepID=UPI003B8D3877
MNAPTEIDGAKVLLTIILNDSYVPTGFTTHYAKGFENLNRLAICKYDEDPEFYLFYCDSDW